MKIGKNEISNRMNQIRLKKTIDIVGHGYSVVSREYMHLFINHYIDYLVMCYLSRSALFMTRREYLI